MNNVTISFSSYAFTWPRSTFISSGYLQFEEAHVVLHIAIEFVPVVEGMVSLLSSMLASN